MDSTYEPGAWRRLGSLLQERRGQLGYGFRERGRFLRERGGSHPVSLKTIGRLERGERDSYPDGTVAKFESMYGWEPGSFGRVLEGGDPVPRGEAPRPAAGTGASPGAAVTPIGRSAPLDLSGDEQAMVKRIVLMSEEEGGPLPWVTCRGMIRDIIDINDARAAPGEKLRSS